MKMKLKAVAAAVALALVAGQASAAIDQGNALLNSELFLIVYSPTLNGGTSYTRDLGVSFQQFGAGAGGSANLGLTGTTAPVANTSANPIAFGATPTVATGAVNAVNASGYQLNFGVDSVLNSSGLLSQTDVVWMVGAFDSNGGGVNGVRTLTTATGPVTPVNGSSTQASGMPGQGTTFVASVNYSGTHSTQTNGSSVNLPGTPAYAEFMGSWNGTLPSNNAMGALGQALQFFLITPNTSTSAPALVYQYANTSGASTWLLNADGTLSFTASAVPLPAAVWLFGSGLLGLIGIARRRKLDELSA